MDFKVSNKRYLFLGLIFACLGIAYTVVMPFLDQGDNFDPMLALSGVVITGCFCLPSFLVKRIIFEPDGLVLEPVGVKIHFSSILEAKLTWPDFYEQEGRLNQLKFKTPQNRYVWVPFYLLWLDNMASLNVGTVEDPHGFVTEMEARLKQALI